MRTRVIPLPTEEATEALGRALAAALRAGDVVLLEGDLGAGKTTLVRALAAALDVPGEVTSPTFGLVHELGGGRLPLVHADLYRIERGEDVEEIGLPEAVARAEAAVLVEWGARFRGWLEPIAVEVALSFAEGGGRVASVSSGGPRGDEIVRRLAAVVAL